jgi:hypothetical protein
MLHTNFVANGTRYQLITVGISRHEREHIAANIKPDPGMWKKAGKRGLGALKDEKIRKTPNRRHYKK